MPIGPLRATPKVDIQLDKDAYQAGDELRAKIIVHTSRPGMTVRWAVADFVLVNRYTHIRSGQVLDTRAYGPMNPRAGIGPVLPSPFRPSTFAEERADRVVLCREKMFENGVIRHRTETFELRCEVKAPQVRRTMERRASYMVIVQLDLPRMRDVEQHKTVNVQIV